MSPVLFRQKESIFECDIWLATHMSYYSKTSIQSQIRITLNEAKGSKNLRGNREVLIRNTNLSQRCDEGILMLSHIKPIRAHILSTPVLYIQIKKTSHVNYYKPIHMFKPHIWFYGSCSYKTQKHAHLSNMYYRYLYFLRTQ